MHGWMDDSRTAVIMVRPPFKKGRKKGRRQFTDFNFCGYRFPNHNRALSHYFPDNHGIIFKKKQFS
jgi:hypothetical protein